MERLKITVGDQMDNLLSRAAEIDEAVASGKDVSEAVPQINFATQALRDEILTESRTRILERHLDHPDEAIADRAAALKMTPESVAEDMAALEMYGLLDWGDEEEEEEEDDNEPVLTAQEGPIPEPIIRQSDFFAEAVPSDISVNDVLADMARLAESLSPANFPSEVTFAWNQSQGLIAVAPPNSESFNREIASELLAELREKVGDLRARLQGSNVNPQIPRSLEKLHAVLPDDLDRLNPGLLLSRSRSVQAFADAYMRMNQYDMELSTDALAMLVDVAHSTADLKACFPIIREIERERLAQNVQEVGVESVVHVMDELVTAARNAGSVVSDEVADSLRDKEEQIVGEVRPAIREEAAAEAMMMARNFAATALRVVIEKVRSGDDGTRWKGAKGAQGYGFMPALAASVAGLIMLTSQVAGPVAKVTSTTAGIVRDVPETARRALDMLREILGTSVR